MKKHRPPGDRVEDLVRVGTHARPLPCGKHDDGEALVLAHVAARNGMAPRRTPEVRGQKPA
jgi:hypothetical protein